MRLRGWWKYTFRHPSWICRCPGPGLSPGKPGTASPCRSLLISEFLQPVSPRRSKNVVTPFPQFQQKRLQVADDRLFQIFFVQGGTVRQIKEFQHIGGFEDLLSGYRFARQPLSSGRNQSGPAAIGNNPLKVGRLNLPLKLGLAPTAFDCLQFVEGASIPVRHPHQGA